MYVYLWPETVKILAQFCKHANNNKEVTSHNGGGRPTFVGTIMEGTSLFFLPSFAYLDYILCFLAKRHTWMPIEFNSLYKRLKEQTAGSSIFYKVCLESWVGAKEPDSRSRPFWTGFVSMTLQHTTALPCRPLLPKDAPPLRKQKWPPVVPPQISMHKSCRNLAHFIELWIPHSSNARINLNSPGCYSPLRWVLNKIARTLAWVAKSGM